MKVKCRAGDGEMEFSVEQVEWLLDHCYGGKFEHYFDIGDAKRCRVCGSLT